ncbi:MAG: type II toxin-antitoxin system HipA family toxin [Clostridiales bacterium]|jgi:serine/threonine-protein kinase HipA|nr:type II toxin-antitoxin system HipA family toxin [Clostridiales bacterium]
MDEKIKVSISIDENTTVPVGVLWCSSNKGKLSSAFEYEDSWLDYKGNFAIEPALQLSKRVYYSPKGRLFGCMGDSSPDRWGRMLMHRNELKKSRASGKPQRSLSELDYLLMVSDYARQGALRYSKMGEASYLSDSNADAVPQFVLLPRLLAAAERFIESKETLEDLKALLAPGSSLGGARPKASVFDSDGSLSIAKFERKGDEYDVVAWEAVALSIAKDFSLNVPSFHLKKIEGKSVLMVKRFDRLKGARIPFVSAMTMLGSLDNEERSYLEIADAIQQYGSQPSKDLKELWSRIVFGVLVTNTDDHLRNHGFLYDAHSGWRLSPAYDINPTPDFVKPRQLSTCIDFQSHEASLELALSVSNEFRLSLNDAKRIASDAAKVTLSWREKARGFGIAEAEIDSMSSAFEHSEQRMAEKL